MTEIATEAGGQTPADIAYAQYQAGTGGNFRGAQPSPLSTELALPFTSLAGIISDIVFHPSQIVSGAIFNELTGNGTGGNGGNGGDQKTKLLLYLLGGIVVIAAAPVIYRAVNPSSRGKRQVRQERIASSLDDASNRATSALGAISSAAFNSTVVGFPLAYIALQELEDRHIIRSGVGNTLQGLMAGGVVAKMVGDIVPL